MFLRNNFFSNFQLKIDKRTRQLCFIEIGETLEIVLCRYEHTYVVEARSDEEKYFALFYIKTSLNCVTSDAQLRHYVPMYEACFTFFII
jgi:hypothetical protein